MFDWLPLDLQQLGMQQLAHFHLLRPWWLLAFLPFLWIFRFLLVVRNPVGRWRNVIAPHLLKVMLVRHGRASWFNPVTLSMAVMVLIIVALAGPTWKQQPSPFSEDIAALVIALDVSSSMQQQDVQPSRLERAKQKIHDLLALRPGGRVGLIVYAGSAHSVIPLTNDADVVNNFLSAITTDMMPRKGKFPEKSLPIAEQMLQDSPVPGTILLIGDGVSPNTGKAFSNYFSERQHHLLVMGVGTDSLAEAGAAADDVYLPLETTALSKLASNNDGYYQSLTLEKDDVKNLNRRIDNYLVIVDDGSRPWVDAGYYLLFPMALLMLLWFRKGWTLHWCLVLIVISSMASPAPVIAEESMTDDWNLATRFMSLWLTPDQQGRVYMEKGDYKTAATRFEDIAWRGIAYYRAENFKAAAEMFSRIDTAEGFFNLANAQAHGRNYVSAVKIYDKVLKIKPSHAGALKNRDMIQKIIDEIDLMSASQKAEDSDSSRELGEDEPQTADGVERQDFIEREVKQLSAEQILLDEQVNDLWMQQVQKDPSRFLSVKFHMQLQREEASDEP
ncbi:MAG: VWA domain-containing protein [Proteobacteria bacterium]|nr:VWA domain-containing protein [Pseudomonadota bacterium]